VRRKKTIRVGGTPLPPGRAKRRTEKEKCGGMLILSQSSQGKSAFLQTKAMIFLAERRFPIDFLLCPCYNF